MLQKICYVALSPDTGAKIIVASRQAKLRRRKGLMMKSNWETSRRRKLLSTISDSTGKTSFKNVLFLAQYGDKTQVLIASNKKEKVNSLNS